MGRNKGVCWRLHFSRYIWQPCLRWPSETLQKEYTRKEADLFKVAQFKAKSEASIKVVREMLYDDNISLVIHSAKYMHSLVEKFARAAS